MIFKCNPHATSDSLSHSLAKFKINQRGYILDSRSLHSFSYHYEVEQHAFVALSACSTLSDRLTEIVLPHRLSHKFAHYATIMSLLHLLKQIQIKNNLKRINKIARMGGGDIV